jgi:hypothetical protein
MSRSTSLPFSRLTRKSYSPSLLYSRLDFTRPILKSQARNTIHMSNSSDINAQHFLEISSLGPDSPPFSSMAEYRRMVAHPAYSRDPIFREKVDARLSRSMDVLAQPDPAATGKATSVTVTKAKDGSTHSEINHSPGFHSRSEEQPKAGDAFDENGVSVRESAGHLSIHVIKPLK